MQGKMKYRPTPLNIVCGITIIISIWCVIFSGSFGFGILLGLFYLLPFGLIGLLIDYIIQKLSKKYIWTFSIDLFILGILTLSYGRTQRTKTLIIPDHLTSQYITTIYGVDTEPRLPKGVFTWSYEIRVPENGILLTSSDINDDLPETKMKTYSGTELNTESTELGWVRFTDDKFDCNEKTYHYQSWMVDSSCCLYSNHEVDSFKINLHRQFCGQ